MEEKGTIQRTGLARALSKLGYCSRSQAVELIHAGRVRVNDKVRRDADTPVHLEKDRVVVDDRPVESSERIYLVMNKPRGVVTTASDEKGRETVYDVLLKWGRAEEQVGTKEPRAWIAPIGRLDKASEGLLLLTNDSEWGSRVAAPETHLEKTYHVQVGTVADENLIQLLVSGVTSDGELLRAKQSRVLRSGQKNCWLEIVLDEGRNRQIRRMLAAHGVEVLRLMRVAIGPLQLGNLAKGAVRPLTNGEKRMLDRAMQARNS